MSSATRPENGWIQTFTGKKFWPVNPQPEDVDIIDIAHALSLTNRFSGHTAFPYSVAQHCVLMASYATNAGHDKETCLQVLLHDAAEAYLPDVTRPVKPFLTGFRDIEYWVHHAICTKFGLPCPGSAATLNLIKELDIRILVDERKALMPGNVHHWTSTENVQGLGVPVRCGQWSYYEAEFLRMFHTLYSPTK